MMDQHIKFPEEAHHYSEKQQLWIGHKANWEGMSRGAVLNDWTPPPDDALCIHGATACTDTECAVVPVAATVGPMECPKCNADMICAACGWRRDD